MGKSRARKASSVDSITAPQSSVFFRDEGLAHPLAELFDLAAGLAEPHRRRAVARALAKRAGAVELIIFVIDPEIGVLLPAPGFCQTLPASQRWRAFLSEIARRSPALGTLPSLEDGGDLPALGLSASDGSVIIFLGGQPDAGTALAIRTVLPVLASAFRGEQTVVAANGNAEVAREAAGQAKLLATSLENARRALQEALMTAEGANKAKDQFLAVLSHELRTPLGPVLTTASALLADPTLSAELREALEMIRRNAELEVRLIDDLLDMTRITKGKMLLSLDTVDIHTLIQQTLQICQSDIYRKKLQVSLDLKAAEHHVQGDPARLQQVLWNLVKNSVKFTPAEGRITIASANAAGGIGIDVSDTGVGIEPAFLTRVFDAFEQTSDTVTHRFGGLGLGLAISKALVQAHGGSLAAASAGKGKGATFSMTLAVVAEPVPAARPGDGEDCHEESGGRLQLLLVEDHRDTAAVMTRLLQSLGHDVSAAASIEAALEVAGRKSFDLVLSDLGLPDGSGLDLMRELGRRFGLPGVAISGYGMEEDVVEAKKAGFYAHLTKPIDLRQIQAILSQFATNLSKRRGHP